MNRREFIKLGSFAVLFAMMDFHPINQALRQPAEIEAGGRLFKGTDDGIIWVSEDSGASWKVHSRFGQEYAINRFTKDAQERVYASLSYQNYPIRLTLSKNGTAWVTAS